MHQLLAHCARIQSDQDFYADLTRQANQFNDWQAVPTQAEQQGLGPLVYFHLKEAGIAYDARTRRMLQALYSRHRHANQVRSRVLSEILTAYQAAEIEVVVLKGMALSHLIYPEPGLRPMRDIDLLVKESQLPRALAVLSKLGFNPSSPDESLLDKHIEAARQTEGLSISVELHHNLFDSFQRVSMTLATLTAPPLNFNVGDCPARTLGYEDMLWHLCQHVAYHASIWEPIRLIWVADLVGFSEQFVNEIDWERVARQYPLVLNMLSLFHFMTPLSEKLRQQAGIKLGQPPQGVGQEFEGWPRKPLAAQRRKGLRRAIADTFLPSEWWLRLHYGLDSVQPLFWYRWFRHPFYILGPFYLAEKVRLGWYQQVRPRLFKK